MITGDYSTLGLLIADNTNIKSQLDKLADQVATGHVADSYGGLGAPAQTSLNIRPQLNQLTTEQAVIGAVTGQQDVTQTALKQIATIASNFEAQTVSLNGLDTNAVDSVAAAAKAALQQVAELLNTTNGSIYVFAGTDSSNQPVPNPDSITNSGFYTQIHAAVAGLSSTTDNAASVSASTLATASSTTAGATPFSASLETNAQVAVVQLGAGQQVQSGLLANKNTLAVSTGVSTTGSYTRDLLRGLATLASLSSAQVRYPGFNTLVADTRTSLRGVVSTLATETGALGDIQSNLTRRSTEASEASTALLKQVSSVEDVNTATALTDLSAVQTQLQASYKIIATAKSLSLVQYL